MPLRPFHLTSSKVHRPLGLAAERMQLTHLRDLFASDDDRVSRLSMELNDLYVDFSKHRVDGEVMELLYRLADEAGLKAAIEAQFTGVHINATEDRAVLHTALRSQENLHVDGQAITSDVSEVKKRMQAFTEAVRSGQHKGYTGKTMDTVVNIGIGGSDLGPAMVVEALSPDATLEAHFVSNVDGADLASVLRRVNPETTLFIVVSKTFTTQETLTNAHAARTWLIERLGNDAAVNVHFAAVSTNLKAVADFGIQANRVFGFWDWVGGRYSLWSSVGLSIAIACGWSSFEDLLKGAQRADLHFRTAPWQNNIPVTMALLGVWYRNYLKFSSHAVIPYSHHLRRFPAYLQQADMESNGKYTGRDGKRIGWASGPVIWGEPGTNGQHAFFQLLHQGTDVIPVDFIAFAAPLSGYKDHHTKLLANCIAQSEALMNGKTYDEVAASMRKLGKTEAEIGHLAPFRVFDGNRPNTVFLFPQLNASYLGMLIALYEHKIFVQGIIWNVYSYDQWGVELGKELAGRILPAIEYTDNQVDVFDASTHELIRRCK